MWEPHEWSGRGTDPRGGCESVRPIASCWPVVLLASSGGVQPTIAARRAFSAAARWRRMSRRSSSDRPPHTPESWLVSSA